MNLGENVGGNINMSCCNFSVYGGENQLTIPTLGNEEKITHSYYVWHWKMWDFTEYSMWNKLKWCNSTVNLLWHFTVYAWESHRVCGMKNKLFFGNILYMTRRIGWEAVILLCISWRISWGWEIKYVWKGEQKKGLLQVGRRRVL